MAYVNNNVVIVDRMYGKGMSPADFPSGNIPILALSFSSGEPLQFSNGSYLEFSS